MRIGHVLLSDLDDLPARVFTGIGTLVDAGVKVDDTRQDVGVQAIRK